MFDVENVKMILQAEVNKRENSKLTREKHCASGDKNLEELYEMRYQRYRSRFDGMCDMLFDLGYMVWCNDDNEVFVEKRVKGENYISVDVPF